MPAAFTRLNARNATLLGVPPSAFVQLLGMSPEYLNDDRYRTPAATNVRVWQLMTTKAPWTDVAAFMTHRSPLGHLGVWDYLLTSAPSPLEGLRDAVDYLATVADTGTETLLVSDRGAEITISHVNAADLADDVASAIRCYALSLLQKRFSEASRRPLVPVRVALAARAPRHHAVLTNLYGTQNVEFEHAVSSVTFRSTDLREPTPYAPPGLSALLRSHAAQSLAQAVPLRGWLDLFRTALKGAVEEDTHDLTLTAHARHMAISSRTLQRRLEEHGTTWRAELESARIAHVEHLLHTTPRTLDSIAARSGYADARSLRRAVRRATGQTPSSQRWRQPPPPPEEQ
ncbi:AraC family transcriptional regulator ligand-binding domain-containing protein [Streptomyces sp. NPDC003035]|uniref:AraC family transcriptional regulator ligand-binding domain-containing protein n=1 Tax=Streptomyces sp. NPDC003035 TaxID=3364676 RepID=UPI0036A22EAB